MPEGEQRHWRATGARALLAAVTTALVFAAEPSANPLLPNPCLLLSSAQVASVVGGSPASHTLGGNKLSRTCTWTGPPLGYMQTQSTLYVTVSQISKARFLAEQAKTHQARIDGLGTPAYGNKLGLTIWKDNVMLNLDNAQLAVTPTKAIALARAALREL